MDIMKLSDQNIQDDFSDAFEAEIASLNKITEFECVAIRNATQGELTVEVSIIGMAGSPTIDDFKEKRVENGNTLTVNTDRLEGIEFKLQDDVLTLNSNDYMVTYKAKV